MRTGQPGTQPLSMHKRHRQTDTDLALKIDGTDGDTPDRRYHIRVNLASVMKVLE